MTAPTCIEPPRQIILKDDDKLASIGTPRVVVTYFGGEARVEVDRPVWGWADTTRIFLNPSSPGVMRYAEKVFARLAEEAAAKSAYQSKRKLRNALGRELSRLTNRENGQ